MSAEQPPPAVPTPAVPGTAQGGGIDSRHGWWSGRGGLILAALTLGVALYLTHGIVTMTVPPGAESPGPAFFPTVLAVCAYVLSAAVALYYVRNPEPPQDADGVVPIEGVEAHPTFTDWRTLGLTVLAFLLFALLLNPAGWIVAAALMFWIITWAMGSGTPVRDIAIALVLSCAVQVVFSAGLGLHLPAGILEGVL